MGLGTVAAVGALLALQAGLMQVYYSKRMAEISPATCPAVLNATHAEAVSVDAAAAAGSGEAVDAANSPRIEVLHEDARIFLYRKFLTDEECEHIIKLAEPTLARSGVVETATGQSKIDSVRTSKGTFLRRGHDAVIAGVESRIAKWTLMPVGNGEGMQVLKYDVGEEYAGHFDYFFHKEGVDNGGNRLLTVLMYLNDVEEGGETCFPNIPAPEGDNGPEFSECARKILAVKPRRGDAVLFHSIKPSGELERRSLHTACPVLKGVKLSAPKWVHVGHYAAGGEQPVRIEQVTQTDVNYPECKDANEACASWSSSGECDKNTAFMVGTKERPGSCIKACGKCADFFDFQGGPRTEDKAQEAQA